MKRLALLWLFVLVFWAALKVFSADVRVTVSTPNMKPITNSLLLTNIVAPSVANGGVAIPVNLTAIPVPTATNSVATFSNLVEGSYRITVKGMPGIQWTIAVPDTNGTVDATSIISTGTNSTSNALYAWSAVASDARYWKLSQPSLTITGSPAVIYLQSTADGIPVQTSISLDDIGDFTFTGQDFNFGPGPIYANDIFAARVEANAISAASFVGSGSGLTNLLIMPTGTADDVVIAAGLARASSGGVVQLGAGTFVLSNPLAVNGATLIGSGPKTVIQVSNIAGSVAIGVTNGSIRSLTVAGSGATNRNFQTGRVALGGNSTASDVTITNHSYGLDVEGAINVVVSGLRCYNIRDNQGQAAAFHAGTGTTNAVLTGFVFEQCDRGSEVENGAQRVTVQCGVMRDIWWLNGSNTYSLSIDAHTHPGYGATEGVTYRDIYATNCAPIHIGNDTSGGVDIAANVVLENMVIDGPAVYGGSNMLGITFARDVALRNVQFKGTRTGTNIFSILSATNVLFDNCRWTDATETRLQMNAAADGVTLRGGSLEQGTHADTALCALHINSGQNLVIDGVKFSNLSNATHGVFFDSMATNVVIRGSTFVATVGCQRWLKWNGKNLTLTGNSFLGTPTVQGVDFGTSHLGTVSGNYLAAKGFIFRSDAIGFQVWGNTGTAIMSDSSLTETVTIYARSNSLPSAATLAAVLGGPGAGIRSYTNALLGYTLDASSNLTWKVLLP